MSAHLIYDETSGAILKALTISASIASTDAFVAANTPNGASALSVDETHPALADQVAWKVSDGQLVAVPQPTPAEIASARAAQSAKVQAAYQAAVPAQIAQYLAAFEKQKTLLAQIAAARTVAEVQKIAWS